MKRWIYIACCMSPMGLMGQPTGLSVQASISDSSIKIGEQVMYTLKISVPAGLKINSITWPEFTDTITKPVEIIQQPREMDSYTRSWLVTSFDSGYHALPPAVVFVDTMAFESNPVLLEVHTVEVDTTKDFKDIKDIIGASAKPGELSSGISPWWYVSGIAVILAVVIFFMMRKKKKEENHPVAPTLSLTETYLKRLLEIEQQQWWQQGEVKKYYTEVTDVVREYIYKRFLIRAQELTSHQLLHQLKLAGIPESLQYSLKELFSLADMAKFARVKPIAQENELAIEIARRFIHETEPAPEISEEI